MYIMGLTKFKITVACGLKFHWYLRTLSLKFQKARTKIEVFRSLPCWLSQFSFRQENFFCSLLKGVSSKRSGNLIVSPDLCFLS